MSEIERLRQAGIENPEREWRILSRNFEGQALETALSARLNRQPMAQILGVRSFWKDEFIVTKDTLDPRPDSELFMELATSQGRDFTHILDMGTGTGALALSLLREFPNAHALGSDISQSALEVAKRNAQSLGLNDRAEFIQSNWFENINGRFDLIVCNPPYLTQAEWQSAQPELKHEPRQALTDDADGLMPYRAIARSLAQHLKRDGVAYFEHGYQQQADVLDIFAEKGFAVQGHTDINGAPRIVEVFH